MDKCSLERLTRKKVITFEDTALPRVLTLLDLTTLGIGSTIGVGFYVLAGEVAQSIAGPAVIISFLIAAVASLFAGLCYAEFGGRVPKAGSAYIYTYVCIGEFIAFIIGWNLILEYVIGTASIASGFSGYIDAFVNNVISDAMRKAMPIDVSFLAPYPDFLAAGLCLLLAAVLAFGVKESSLMNNVVTIINLVVVAYVIITAATLADINNWSLSLAEVNASCNGNTTSDWGAGGFTPYGFSGIMQGAATCFYGFVGFDVIASTGEEALRPERNLPLSICLSLFFVFMAYFGMSTVLTLALPYCDQDASAPLIYLYESFDMQTAKIIVSVGALFGFSASLFGAIFPMPRVIYAMASDGLLFRFLSRVNKRFRSPIVATMVSGAFAAAMAMLFDLEVLIHMMSIGTLQAYTIVALCVMMLRYSADEGGGGAGVAGYTLLRYSVDPNGPEAKPLTGASSPASSLGDTFSLSSYLRQAINSDRITKPNRLSTSFVAWASLLFLMLCFITTVLLVVLGPELSRGSPGAIVACCVTGVAAVAVVVCVSMQPQSDVLPAFQVPLVPWLPALSCFFNLYLMCNLPSNTWIKFVIWMAVGLTIYFVYGVWYNPTPPSEKRGGVKNSEVNHVDGDLEIPTILVQTATPHDTLMDTKEDCEERRISRDVVMGPEETAVQAELMLRQMRMEEQRVEGKVEGDGDVEVMEGNEGGRRKAVGEEDSGVGSSPSLPLASAAAVVTSVTAGAVVTALLLASSDDTKQEDSSDANFDKELPKTADDAARDDLTYGWKSVSDDALDREGEKAINDAKDDRGTATSSDSGCSPDVLNSSSSYPVLPTLPSSVSAIPLHVAVCKSFSLDNIDSTDNDDQGGIKAVSSSVPATPVNKRHPIKKFTRMSSFEFIPPSSPDSPLATRVNAFVVIPVQEPKLDVDADHHTDSEASFVMHRTEGDEGEGGSASGVQAQLKVGSSSEADSSIVEQAREFRLGLPPIRERGESKVLAVEEVVVARTSDAPARDDSSSSPSEVPSVTTESFGKSSESLSGQKVPDGLRTGDKLEEKVTTDGDTPRPHFHIVGSDDSVESVPTTSSVTSSTPVASSTPVSNSTFVAANTTSDQEKSAKLSSGTPVVIPEPVKISFQPSREMEISESKTNVVLSNLQNKPTHDATSGLNKRDSVKDLQERFSSGGLTSDSSSTPTKPAIGTGSSASIERLRSKFQ